MKRDIKSRLVPAKDFGAIVMDGVERLPLGLIYGKVSRLVKRNTPTGESYGGFGGAFEIAPYNEKMPMAQSSILFLPDEIAALLLRPFAEMQKENPNTMLVFRFEVTAVKANNAQGYALEYRPLGSFMQADALSDVRLGLPERKKVTGRKGR